MCRFIGQVRARAAVGREFPPRHTKLIPISAKESIWYHSLWRLHHVETDQSTLLTAQNGPLLVKRGSSVRTELVPHLGQGPRAVQSIAGPVPAGSGAESALKQAGTRDELRGAMSCAAAKIASAPEFFRDSQGFVGCQLHNGTDRRRVKSSLTGLPGHP